MDLGVMLVNKLRGRPAGSPLLDAGVPPLTPVVTLAPDEKAAEARRLKTLESSTRELARSVLVWARARGLRATLGETHRSLESQTNLPAGRTGIAPGKIGWHQVGRAFHIVIRDERGQIDRGSYRAVGNEFERRGGVWLGRRPLRTRAGTLVDDFAHFEYHPGMTLPRYRGTALAAREMASAERRAARYG